MYKEDSRQVYIDEYDIMYLNMVNTSETDRLVLSNHEVETAYLTLKVTDRARVLTGF
jgi:hypothetical protein